jgi:hypothetical protein
MQPVYPEPDKYFCPPEIPELVFCLHCKEAYESYLIYWRVRETPRGLKGFWTCPTEGCGGIGYGCDIHPADGFRNSSDEDSGEDSDIFDDDDLSLHLEEEDDYTMLDPEEVEENQPY